MQYRAGNFLYGGIDFSVPGEGGPDCTDFLSPQRRLVETAVFGSLSLLVAVQSWRTVRLERNNNHRQSDSSRMALCARCSVLEGEEEEPLKYILPLLEGVWNLILRNVASLISDCVQLSISVFSARPPT